MGYTPDTNHSLAMMVAAFVGVIGWSIVGFSGADGIFPSVPGMGAAFIVHFVMNQTRTPDVSPFGRYAVPDLKKMGAIAATIIVSFCAFEVTYLVTAPSNSSGGVGDYVVIIEEQRQTLAQGTEYVADGETLTLEFNTDSIESWPNGDNVVGVWVTLLFSEDETSSGLGCGVLSSGDPEPDTITGAVARGEFNGSDSQTNDEWIGLDVIVKWYDEYWIDNMNEIWIEDGDYWADFVSGYSESEIEDKLDVGGVGLGDYKLDITVDVEMGGGQNCEHTDDGEEVEYVIEIGTMSQTIIPFDEFLGDLV